ncbi:MAG: L-glutamine synthetase [Solirubrobacterales bacterium]|jgi:glutamine synthetase|nr:L-glutamine synthetase [Solirubrobacterales bacterium]
MSASKRPVGVDAVSEFAGEGVEMLRVLYPDLHGVARGKDLPLAEVQRAEEGLPFCLAIMGTDLRHTPVVPHGAYPDLIATPDFSTLKRLPWEPEVVACLADLHRPESETALPPDPRGATKRVIAALEEIGLDPVVGPELEFFLLTPDPEAPGGARRRLDRFSMVYTVGPQADPEGVVRNMARDLSAMGIGAYAMNHEFMNSQYEINLHHSGALDAADRAFWLRTGVKDIAAQHGLLATFMGKPFNDQGGSGFHFHLSLNRSGANAFDDPESDDGVGAEMRHALAGILSHAPALMAFLNPTINAYRRLVPDSLAPTHANWGWDNRTTFVRIPPERGPATRIEVRVGDGSANAHLAIAGLLCAALHGIRDELELRPPQEGDAYAAEEPGDPLPGSLDQALDALERDETLSELIGAETVEAFVAAKRFECERHSQWVSEWELDEYLRHL